MPEHREDEIAAPKSEAEYEAAAANVDLSDLAVVCHHVANANPREWPKPLLYALLDTLATRTQERDEALERNRELALSVLKMQQELAASRRECEALRTDKAVLWGECEALREALGGLPEEEP